LRTVRIGLVEAHPEADDADRDRIGDRPVEIELAAAGEETVDRVQEGIEAEQHQRAAVEGQHHRLDVPVAELEAPVLALAADQARDEERQARHRGIDGGKHAIEHDGQRTRQQAEHDAEQRDDDRHPDRQSQDPLFRAGLQHAAA
jgi:hypothetical protein